jgi:ribosome-associated heat shock protein Hsp15
VPIVPQSDSLESCRADVWLWRARFFKTRSLAARVIEQGGVRVARAANRAPIDKPSRTLRVGDVVIFEKELRWVAARVEGFGERRGPASEARALYSLLADA